MKASSRSQSNSWPSFSWPGSTQTTVSPASRSRRTAARSFRSSPRPVAPALRQRRARGPRRRVKRCRWWLRARRGAGARQAMRLAPPVRVAARPKPPPAPHPSPGEPAGRRTRAPLRWALRCRPGARPGAAARCPAPLRALRAFHGRTARPAGRPVPPRPGPRTLSRSRRCRWPPAGAAADRGQAGPALRPGLRAWASTRSRSAGSRAAHSSKRVGLVVTQQQAGRWARTAAWVLAGQLFMRVPPGSRAGGRGRSAGGSWRFRLFTPVACAISATLMPASACSRKACTLHRRAGRPAHRAGPGPARAKPSRRSGPKPDSAASVSARAAPSSVSCVEAGVVAVCVRQWSTIRWWARVKSQVRKLRPDFVLRSLAHNRLNHTSCTRSSASAEFRTLRCTKRHTGRAWRSYRVSKARASPAAKACMSCSSVGGTGLGHAARL